MVSNCPRCQIVWCVKLSGVKLSAVSNCPFLQVMSNCPGFKLSGVKLSWSKIVRGVKLSVFAGVKFSTVSNCPRCQIIWCQIGCGVKLSTVSSCPFMQVLSNCPIIGNMDACDNLSDDKMHRCLQFSRFLRLFSLDLLKVHWWSTGKGGHTTQLVRAAVQRVSHKQVTGQ